MNPVDAATVSEALRTLSRNNYIWWNRATVLCTLWLTFSI